MSLGLAGGVDQDEVAVAHRQHGLAQFLGRVHDAQRRADDVGVFFQLIDGRDAVGVDGHEADAAVLVEF